MANDPTGSTRTPSSLVIAYCDYAYKGSPDTDLILLAASIRRIGGTHDSTPVWIMCRAAGKKRAQALEKATTLRVELLPYRDVPELRDFPFAQKVFAAAEAERLAEGRASELLWFDRDSLVLNDVSPLLLRPDKNVSFRPVNVQNIGEEAGTGPEGDRSGFWRRACELAGADYGALGTTTGYIDRKVLLFYIAAGLVGVRPELGIFREWERLLRAFAADRFLQGYCEEHSIYKIFMHQAALSIAVAGKIGVGERQELPTLAMYPLNFWEDDPNACRPTTLDDLISLRYDTVLDDEDWLRFPMSAELRNWLRDNIR
jgi:hypothetical protein